MSVYHLSCFLKKIIKDAFIFAFSILLIIYLNNCIHCVVNRQHLVRKHLNTSLHLSLTIIIQTRSNPMQKMIEYFDNFARTIMNILFTFAHKYPVAVKGYRLACFVLLYDSVI